MRNVLVKHIKIINKTKKKWFFNIYQETIFLSSYVVLIPLISKSQDNFVKADTVKADTLFCLRSRMVNFSLLADTLEADTFSTSKHVS